LATTPLWPNKARLTPQKKVAIGNEVKIAFYAPLKAPDHPVPSGDRQMARLLMKALAKGGFDVSLASRLRSFHAEPRPLDDMRREAAAERTRLSQQWAQEGKPDLWFTYHLYYKAPDLLGPDLAREWQIPYITAEASYAGKRDRQGWAEAQALIREAVALAQINLCFTDRDRPGLERVAPQARFASLAPFIDTAPFETRAASLPRPRLVTIAMMRKGDKFASFTMLAKALGLISDIPWHLMVIGDGPLRAETMALFDGVPSERVDWRGELPAEAVPSALSEGGIYVWPGCGEAYGLAYLEAEAAGMPVVAQATAGVPAVVQHGKTGLLTAEGDIQAFAAAIRELLLDDEKRKDYSHAARDFVLEKRSLRLAAVKLGMILRGAAP
jgi:glycosyltransferase involved in cell wall biosynthesis